MQPSLMPTFQSEEYFEQLVERKTEQYFPAGVSHLVDHSRPLRPIEAAAMARFLEVLSNEYLVWEVLSESRSILYSGTTNPEQLCKARMLFENSKVPASC